MNPELIELLTQQWKDICAKYSTSELNDTFEFVKANSSDLVSEFYTQMMKEQHALEFLSVGIVHSKLQQTLDQWILDSFEVIETSENGKTYKVINENDIFSLEVIDA